MEVKIGVQHSPRELVIDSPKTPDEIEKDVAAAMSGSSTPSSALVRAAAALIRPSQRTTGTGTGGVSARPGPDRSPDRSPVGPGSRRPSGWNAASWP